MICTSVWRIRISFARRLYCSPPTKFEGPDRTSFLLAKNDAIVREIKAKAEAYAIEQGAIAEAYKITQLKGAQLQQFTDLTAAINMTQAELLQYVYMNVLKESKHSEMFLDYKKVPLFLEDSN